MREIPILGTVRIGNQKDPFGYEHLTSSRWLNFMERSFNQDAFEGPFNNGFLPGIQILNNNEEGDFAWQVGQFKNTTNPFGFSNSNGGSMTVGRLVYLPVFEDEGRKLIHLGMSGRTMEPRRQYTSFDPRPVCRTGPRSSRAVPQPWRHPQRPARPAQLDLRRLGVLQGTWQNMVGLEFVGNNGPWSFQSEYFGSWLYNARTTAAGPLVTNGYQPKPGTNVGTVYYQGGYAEVLYFLTGESRTYSKIEYRFDRPVPHNNYYAIRGGGSGRRLSVSEAPGRWGALQLSLPQRRRGQRRRAQRHDARAQLAAQPKCPRLLQLRLHLPGFREHAMDQGTDRRATWLPRRATTAAAGIHGFGTRLAFDF